MMGSRTWRQLEMATPRLWAKVNLQPHHFRPENVSALQNQLARSGSLPLDIEINFPVLDYNHTKPFAKVLNDHIGRLHTLHIRAETPYTLGKFLEDTFSSPDMPMAAPALEDLAIHTYKDGEWEDEMPASVLSQTAFPSLKSLTLPGYHTFIPMPSSTLTSLTSLSIDSVGNDNGPPVYHIFRLLHQTPNLTFLQYKSPDQYSHLREICFGCSVSSWAPPRWPNNPVSLPISLPYLRGADVSATGSGMDALRCLIAPELEAVHFDGSREEGFLLPYDEDLMQRVHGAIQELAERSSNLRRLVLTEVPVQEQVYSWILSGGETAAVSGGLPFPQLEEFVVRDAQLMEGALTRFAEGEGVALKKLGIHRANQLSGEKIVGAARKAVERLEQRGLGERFAIEFMAQQGPDDGCVKDLEELGVEIKWTTEISGPDTKRDGWWTRDF